MLGKGPDPGADPVGYAKTQILPRNQIETSDKDLKRAIDDLALVYQQFFRTNGGAAAKHALSRAAAKVNTICPGAAW